MNCQQLLQQPRYHNIYEQLKHEHVVSFEQRSTGSGAPHQLALALIATLAGPKGSRGQMNDATKSDSHLS